MLCKSLAHQINSIQDDSCGAQHLDAEDEDAIPQVGAQVQRLGDTHPEVEAKGQDVGCEGNGPNDIDLCLSPAGQHESSRAKVDSRGANVHYHGNGRELWCWGAWSAVATHMTPHEAGLSRAPAPCYRLQRPAILDTLGCGLT